MKTTIYTTPISHLWRMYCIPLISWVSLPYFFQAFPYMFLEMARKNIPVSIIVTPNVFFKVKNEHSAEIEEFINKKHTSFHVYDNAEITFAVTNRFFSLSLFFKNGTFDQSKDLVGFDSSSIKWGKIFLIITRENSIEIKTL